MLPGRAFLRRLIDITRGLKAPHHRVRLNKVIKDELGIWKTFLDQHNGKRFFMEEKKLHAPAINPFTDASGTLGYGALYGNVWFNGQWSPWWKQQNIPLLQLYPITLAL